MGSESPWTFLDLHPCPGQRIVGHLSGECGSAAGGPGVPGIGRRGLVAGRRFPPLPRRCARVTRFRTALLLGRKERVTREDSEPPGWRAM